MKKLGVLLALVLVTVFSGCVSGVAKYEKERANTMFRKYPGEERYYVKNIFGHESDCNAKKLINTKFCQCVRWAEKGKERLPLRKSGETQSDYEQRVQDNLWGYLDRMVKCEQFAPFTLDFEIPENTEAAQKVLEENEGNILTPDNLGDIQPVDKPVGWGFKMASPGEEVDLSAGVKVYKGEYEGGDLFSYLGGSSEYVYKNGLQYFLNKTETPTRWDVREPGECKFVLGGCLYGPEDELEKSYAKFDNGVWIYNESTYSLRKRVIRKVIYDMSGIPLYEIEYSRDGVRESVRYETTLDIDR